MSCEDEMNVDERRKYIHKMQLRYARASRTQKGAMLDEMAGVTGLHRKSLVRLVRGPLDRKKRSRQRERSYGHQVDDALRVIGEAYDGICAERLHSNLVTMAEQLARHGELVLTEGLLDQLERISVSTLQRRFSVLRQDEPRLEHRRPAVQTNPLLRQIPVGRISRSIGVPGHFESDLVHHCGPSASGVYVCTVHMIDVASGWSDRAAVLGRGYVVMQDAFSHMLERIPFPVLEVHPDNDSAFFNAHMLHFWRERARGVHLSRSRPYHKNDNPFIEQGNFNKVRAYVGNERLDTVAQALALDFLYDRLWLYHNAFLPVMRLQATRAVPNGNGATTHIQRVYDQPRTPLERICAAGVLEPHVRERLERLRDVTNPRQLRQEIDDCVDYIASLPCAVPGQSENVYLTLRDRSLRELLEPDTAAPKHRAD